MSYQLMSSKATPLWDVIARCLPYATSWKRLVRRPRHINVLELQAFVKEEKRLCESRSLLRVPFGIDSQVCLGAVVKGRASSRALNDILRQSMAFPLGADVYESFMYFRSESNRADGPTRERDPDPPDLPRPAWIDSVGRSDFAMFDSWMMQHCRHFVKSRIPFDQIGAALDIKQNRIARASYRLKTLLAPTRKKTSYTPEDCLSNSPGVELAVKQDDDEIDPVRPYSERPLRAGASSVAEAVQDSKPAFGDAASHQSSILSSEAVKLLESLPRSQFFLPADFDGFRVPGGLDLFSGRCGVAKQMLSMGAPWVLCYDIERGPGQDLLQPEVRHTVRKLLELKAVATLGAAPICSSFSVAVTPAVRSSRFPRGLPGLRHTMRLKVKQGNQHNDYVADLVEMAEQNLVYYWIENPDLSWWWRQKRWRKFRPSDSSWVFRVLLLQIRDKVEKADQNRYEYSAGRFEAMVLLLQRAYSAAWKSSYEANSLDFGGTTLSTWSLQNAQCRPLLGSWMVYGWEAQHSRLCQDRVFADRWGYKSWACQEDSSWWHTWKSTSATATNSCNGS